MTMPLNYKHVTLSILLTVVSNLSFAQNAEGGSGTGGGVGYTCDGGKTVSMVDSYEAIQNGNPLQVGSGSTYQQKVSGALAGLAKIAPGRAQIYSGYYADMINNNIDWADGSLFNEGDISGIQIPDGCLPVQVAFQRDNTAVGLGEKRYVIAKELFAKMSENEKATLILHELVYRDIFSGASPSGQHARLVTETLFGANLTWGQYAKEMGFQLFPKAEWNGIVGTSASEKFVLNSQASFYTSCDFSVADGGTMLNYSLTGDLKNMNACLSNPTSAQLNTIENKLPCPKVTSLIGSLEIQYFTGPFPGNPSDLMSCQYFAHGDLRIDSLGVRSQGMTEVGMTSTGVLYMSLGRTYNFKGQQFEPIDKTRVESYSNIDFNSDSTMKDFTLHQEIINNQLEVDTAQLSFNNTGKLCFTQVTCLLSDKTTNPSSLKCPKVGDCL